MTTLLTIPQTTNEALRILEREFSKGRVRYKMRCVYGKYAIYKTVGHTTTTLAKRLTKEAATGMMKLLEEDDE